MAKPTKAPKLMLFPTLPTLTLPRASNHPALSAHAADDVAAHDARPDGADHPAAIDAVDHSNQAPPTTDDPQAHALDHDGEPHTGVDGVPGAVGGNETTTTDRVTRSSQRRTATSAPLLVVPPTTKPPVSSAPSTTIGQFNASLTTAPLAPVGGVPAAGEEHLPAPARVGSDRGVVDPDGGDRRLLLQRCPCNRCRATKE